MKIGTTMPMPGPYSIGTGVADGQRTIAQLAETLGFESLWVSDHIVIPTKMKPSYPFTPTGEFPFPPDIPLFEALTHLTFIAALTTRIRIGTSVLVLPHRNPVVMAKMLATLDVLSGGRLILGAGVGYLEEEITLLGAPFEKRGTLSNEYVAAMRELWTNPDPVFEGQFVSFRDIKCEPKPVQAEVPIWFGGHTRPTMRRVVKSGSGCIFGGDSVPNFKAGYQILVEEAANAGRDIDTIEKVVLLVTGYSIDECLRQIDQYSALGIDHFIVTLSAWGSTVNEYTDAMSMFAEKIGLKPFEVTHTEGAGT